MKILWLSHLIPYPPKGGVLQRSFHLLRELTKNHDIDLLAFNQRGLIGPLFPSVEAGVKEADRVLKEYCGRVTFHDIPCESYIRGAYWLALKSLLSAPYNINWLKSKKFRNQLKTWLSEQRYDLIHFDTISLVPYFKCVPDNILTCLDHHNIESHMLLRRSLKENNPLKKLYFYQEGIRLANYERKYCPQFSVNITCSDVDTRRLLDIAPTAKVETIPNGVDLTYFNSQAKCGNEDRLIFIGTMNWYPNVEAVHYIAEKLWPELKRKYPQLECDIVGADPVNSIRALAHKLDGFNVYGFVDDVRPFMEKAAVYVCPIQDGGGTKLKILDAMAMSKAIVAHPTACEGIDVSGGVNVLLAEKPTDFIRSIEKLLCSTKLRDSLGLDARKLIESSYGYEAIGQRLSSLFESCRG